MSGVIVIRALLVANQAVVAAVPVERIFAGDAPIGCPKPALSVKQISGVPTLTVSMNDAKHLHTERIQVTALVTGTEGTPPGDGYPAAKQLMVLVLAACKNTKGVMNGVDVDSVLPDFQGPDLADAPIALLTQSRDFIVKYNA